MEGDVSAVGALIERGAALEAKDKDGDTPLIYASDEGHASVAELLLAKGANREAKDNYGKTALDNARHGNHSDVIALLEAAPKVRAWLEPCGWGGGAASRAVWMGRGCTTDGTGAGVACFASHGQCRFRGNRKANVRLLPQRQQAAG